MENASKAKSLIDMNKRTVKAIDDFRALLKSSGRWSAPHQAAYNAWRSHLQDSEKRARLQAGRRLPKAAWDLAVAEARRERDYWTDATKKAAARPTKEIGLDVFDGIGE